MRQIICNILICLTCFWITSQAVASKALFSPAPQAKILNVLDTQVLGKVNTSYQTKEGIIWLGTDEGLIRFDGYNAKKYSHEAMDNRSLSHNKVTKIIEDKQANLWIATQGGGLNKFSPQQETFTRINLRLNNTDRTFTLNLYDLAFATDNLIWIATDKGIKQLDLTSEKPISLSRPLIDLDNKPINQLMIDHQQRLWLSTEYFGVYRYHKQMLKHYPIPSDQTPGSSKAPIYQDRKNTIWLGTNKGLYHYAPNLERFIKTQTKGAKNQALNAIIEDHLGDLWLGTTTAGVQRYSTNNQQLSNMSGQLDIYRKFDRDNIFSIMTDQQGSMWFATEQGLILINQQALNINYLTNDDGTLLVSDIEQFSDNQIAFAGAHQYFQYNIKDHELSAHMIDQNRVYRISADSKGDLWLATLGQGLQHYAPKTAKLSQIPHTTLADHPTGVSQLFDAYVDSNDKIWMLPFPDLPNLTAGVIAYQPPEQTYNSFLNEHFIKDIIQLDDNHLLLSSDTEGLLSLNVHNKALISWREHSSSVPRRNYNLYKDNNNTLWIGTAELGLARYNPQQKRFSYITTAQGLLSNNIYSITQDHQNNLWLASDKGLSRYNPNTNQVFNIEAKDGLLFDKFYKRAVLKATDEKLYFGAEQGLVIIDPKDFESKQQPLKVFINDFKLFNQSVDWRVADQNNPLSKPIAFTKEIELNHHNYMFSFSFAANEYTRPDRVTFAYMMEGLDDQWVYTNAENRVASYTTLKPNDYTFKVKARNADGVWSEQETAIKISVLPPWWLSWQAYIGYFTFSVLFAYVFINNRTRKLVQHAIALEENVAQRTKELQDSRDQVTDLLAQKQQLFASVSHEFRTPLTLILSPVEHLLADDRGKAVADELHLIKRNGRRLLRMVDQLLEFAKLELHDNSQKEQVSLHQTLDIIVSSFELLVKSKQITLTMQPFNDVSLNMLPDSLNKILINILSNAFKYSPQHSQITVTVINHPQHVEIAIKDTGVGIDEQDLDAVFQRFNRATHGHGEAVPGAGIGLALVKELVEANDGEITLQSTVGEGSTFTVTLPCSPIDVQDQDMPAMSELIHEHLNLELDSVQTGDEKIKADETVETAPADDRLKTILIVDDNPDLRQLLSQQLGGQYYCMVAENGKVGLNKAQEQLPDLIISDVMMPIMDGYDLTKALKNNEMTSHIPVILLTAKGSMEARLKGLQLLVDDYLAKPFNIEELKLRINNILTIRDIVKQRYRQVIDEVNPLEKMASLSATPLEQSFIQRVNEQLAQQYQDGEFSAKALSKALGVSERQLQRKLKAQFDLGFPELLRNYRLNKALEMLKVGQRVSQIYYEVGFSSHSYFSSCFKAKFGKTPKAFQQAL